MKIPKCPACKKAFDKNTTQSGIVGHIRKTAYKEAFNKSFIDKIKTPHLDYIKANYEQCKIGDGNCLLINKMGVKMMTIDDWDN